MALNGLQIKPLIYYLIVYTFYKNYKKARYGIWRYKYFFLIMIRILILMERFLHKSKVAKNFWKIVDF